MITTKTTMSLEHFHDFYYLQALQAETMTELARLPEKQFSHSVEKFQNDLAELCNELIPNMALRTFVYLYAACLGESRHSRTPNAERIFLEDARTLHRNELFLTACDYAPSNENIKAIVDIFAQPWKSGFGGKPWKGIAEALYTYYTMPPAAFIDHVIDLEHNNGTAFNKEDARSTIFFDTNYPNRFSHFLDYKFSNNILKDGPGYSLRISKRICKMVERFCVIFSYKFPYWLSANLKNLTDYDVQWGEKKLVNVEKWGLWMDVTKANRPSIAMLLSETGIDDIYAPHFTVKQLKNKATYAKKKAKEICGKFYTHEIKMEFCRQVNDIVNSATPHCKADKAKVTYSLVPVCVKPVLQGLEIHFFVPYEKIGTPTDYGFRYTHPHKIFELDAKPSDFSTDGGYTNGYMYYNYKKIVLQLGDKAIQLKDKTLEVIFD